MINKRAFSLLELAIVFTIIGLISAAVVAGQKLISESKVRNFIAKLNQIEKSVTSFVAAYDSYPGDFSKAEEYFGSSSCADHSSYSKLTCNGDGNRKIGSRYTAEGGLGESSYAFLHLQLAKLYKDDTDFNPSSLGGSINYYTVSDVNSPSFVYDRVKGQLLL